MEKQRANFQIKRKEEKEEAEKQHALAIAQYERDFDSFENELERCKAETKRYQMEISKKDQFIGELKSKLSSIEEEHSLSVTDNGI